MKKICMLLTAMVLMFSSAFTSYAADSNVTYVGNGRTFVFEPGSEESLTDLFPNFKDVMPGDTLTQKITVRNDNTHYVITKISLRALGATEESKEFLSKLKLTVKQSGYQGEKTLFEAPADETAQLTDWVSLGEFYGAAEVDLDVTLEVPLEMGNDFQDKIGYLEWEFLVEEFPTWNPPPQGTSPTPAPEGAAKTGDDANLALWYSLLGVSAVGLIILFFWRKKDDKED